LFAATAACVLLEHARVTGLGVLLVVLRFEDQTDHRRRRDRRWIARRDVLVFCLCLIQFLLRQVQLAEHLVGLEVRGIGGDRLAQRLFRVVHASGRRVEPGGHHQRVLVVGSRGHRGFDALVRRRLVFRGDVERREAPDRFGVLRVVGERRFE
jgi:hypothetical protein